MRLMDRLRSIVRGPGREATSQSVDWNRVAVAALHMASVTEDVELSCDEVYDLLDQFAEAARRGEDVATLMPLVQRHLDMCPDCREEYEALQRMLGAPVRD